MRHDGIRSKYSIAVSIKDLSACALSCLLLIMANATPLPALADEGKGIDIRFDGDKLLTNPDEEEKTGKSLILQGSVEEKAQFSASARPRLQMERPIPDTFSRRTPVIQHSLFGSDSLLDNSQPLMTKSTSVPLPATPEAPKSADDIAAYLRKMRTLLQNYESTAMTDIFHGGNKVNMQSVNPDQVRGDTEGMISDIRSIVPPKVLAPQHYKLANALSAIRNLLAPNRDNPLAEIGKINPAMSYLNQTLQTYHAGVKNVIAQYGLPSSLDPLGNENNPQAQAMLSGAFSDLSQQLMQKESQMANGNSNSSQYSSFGSLGSGGSTAGGASSLAGLLGSSGGGLQGLSSLMGGSGANTKALSGLLGNSGGNLQGLGSLLGGSGGLQGLTKMMGNGAASDLSGNQPSESYSGQTQDSGSAPNLENLQGDLNSLQQLMQGGGDGSN